MASISFDKGTRWWSVKYLVDPVTDRRKKKPLCKHEGPLPRKNKGGDYTPPYHVRKLAEPFFEMERRVKLGQATSAEADTDLAAYAESYLAGYLGRTEETTKNVRRIIREFVAWCRGRKVKAVQAVTPPTCRAWIVAHAGHFKRSSLRNARNQIAPMFEQARRDRVIPANPWEHVRVEGKDRKELPTYWTEAEVNRLLDAAGGWHRDLILLAVNTGIRISAMLALRWTDIDWDRDGKGYVRVRAAESKSGVAYEVPMTDACRDMLTRRLATDGGPDDGLIFCHPRGGKDGGKHYCHQSTYRIIKGLAAKAGIPDHGDYNHCLRRSFATIALEHGIPFATVSKMLGHSNIRTTEVYIGHRVSEAARHIEGFSIGGQAGPDPAG